jgi:2-amino-4-hydroxy-6-hydroxymethyldihydropteridine diphosphokinase
MFHRVFVTLGSNIDKESNLPAAVHLMGEMTIIIAVSSVYETAPVGLEQQPSFLNAAVLVETEMDPVHFKNEVLAEIERRLGRVRTGDKNAPRTIDADMTLFNQDVFDLDKEHHIPDPQLLEFAHIAVPIAELAPDLPHPETGEPLSDIAARLAQKTRSNGKASLWKRPDVKLSKLQ